MLFFDDDIALSEMLREYLQTTFDCEVTLTHEAAEFWPVIHGCDFDILFLDYQLEPGPSGLTGLDVLTRLQSEGCLIPIVMMTGLGSEKVAAQAIQSGAFDYLVKGDIAFNLRVLPPLVQKAIQRRRLQEAVRRSEEKIQYQAMLLENVRDAVVVWDLSGKITYWNNAAEILYGRPAAEMVGRSAAQVYFPIFSPPVVLPATFDSPKINVERIFLSSAGHCTWVSSQICPLYDNNRVLGGYMDLGRDITLRKLEQEELERGRLLIQRILETSPNIVYTLNLRTNQISYISPKTEPLLGLRISDVMATRNPFFFTMVEPKDLPVLVRHYNQIENLPEGGISEIEYRVRVAHDQWRWLKNRETAFSRDEHGRLIEIIGVCEDITPSKQAEGKISPKIEV